MRNIKPMKLLAMIFLIIGIVFTSMIGVFTAINLNVKNNYTPIEATIVDFARHRSGDKSSTLTVVEYSADGQKYENFLNSYSSTWSVGDSITVYYNPENPEQITFDIPIFMFIVFGTMGIVFIIVGSVFAVKERKLNNKKKRLLESGLTVTATVIDFEINTRISVNHRNPYIIVVEYDDGVKKHRFRSENVWENVTSDCIGETVKVYYEPNNMNNYYVDTAGLFNETYRINDNVIYH